jgi:hypothetical protein
VYLKMFKKKAQAAMEFLMTYGWAILVVLVAIGALAYFGVLSPENLLPEKCTGSAGFECLDNKPATTVGGAATQGSVRFVFKNNQGYTINLYDSSAAAPNTAEWVSSECTATVPAGGGVAIDFSEIAGETAIVCTAGVCPIQNGVSVMATITCANNQPASGKIKGTLGMKYQIPVTGLTHDAQVEINGKVVA